MNAFFRKLQWFAHRDRREAEVREELEFHLAEEAEDRKSEWAVGRAGAAGGSA